MQVLRDCLIMLFIASYSLPTRAQGSTSCRVTQLLSLAVTRMVMGKIQWPTQAVAVTCFQSFGEYSRGERAQLDLTRVLIVHAQLWGND